jgi:hypothetical protein
MVVHRAKRRARVRLEAERILSELGETSIRTLTYRICDCLPYDVNVQQVSLFIRDHPRITKGGSRSNVTYVLESVSKLA